MRNAGLGELQARIKIGRRNINNLRYMNVITLMAENEDHGIWSHQSVQFSPSVMSDSLQPHGQQHARLPCPSPTPRACSNFCPSSQWCYPTISSSVVPFCPCLQSFSVWCRILLTFTCLESWWFLHQICMRVLLDRVFLVVGSSHQVAKVLEFQLQHQSFQWILRTDFL